MSEPAEQAAEQYLLLKMVGLRLAERVAACQAADEANQAEGRPPRSKAGGGPPPPGGWAK